MTVTAGPYEAKIPRVDMTGADELAAALEGQAPMLSRQVAEVLGPLVTVNLARAVRRAVAVGINREAHSRDPEHLADLYELLVAGLDQVTDGCTTPEVENR